MTSFETRAQRMRQAEFTALAWLAGGRYYAQLGVTGGERTALVSKCLPFPHRNLGHRPTGCVPLRRSTLASLADRGWVEVAAADAGHRRYEITPEGRAAYKDAGGVA